MNTNTDHIVVIGAGVVGASVAWHLAQMGAGRVTILEREIQPGTGSTSKANGGIRAQFTTDVNIAMSLLSMEILDSLAADIGEPGVYHKAGYLFVTTQPATLAKMEDAAAFQRARGVTVDVLDNTDIRKRAPWMHIDDLVGGTFGARDGFIDPGGLCNWFLRRAAARGVAIRCNTEVTGLGTTASGGWRLLTSHGPLEADAVVNCAGPWAAGIAQLAGFELPVRPVRRHLILSGPVRDLPATIPMTIDADTGVLIRREGPAVLTAWSNADEPPGFNFSFDDDFILRFAEELEHRFPLVAAGGIDLKHSWCGLYEVSPDHHGIIGEAPGAPGFFLVNGFSGHGVMHSPAAGRVTAELILTGAARSADIAPLSPGRFARGELIHETMVL